LTIVGNLPAMALPSRILFLTGWVSGLLVFVIGQALVAGHPHLEAAWADLAWTLAAAAAAVGCWRASRTSLLAGDSRAWAVVAMACLLWLGGQMIWNWIELVERRLAPFPSPADYLFLLFAPAFALGIAFYRPLRGPAGVTVQQICNLAILLSGMLIAVPLVLHDPLREIGQIGAATLIGVIYPVVYLGAMLFGFFCYGVFRWGLKRRPLLLLILGLAAHAVVTVLYSASLLGNGFNSGDSISVLWLFGFGFISWGAWEYRQVRETIAVVGNRKGGRRLYVFDRLLPVAVIAVLMALAFLNYKTISRGVMPWLVLPTALLMVALAFREWWSFRAELALHRASEAAAAALATSEQEAQEARRNAEEANRAKSRFLAHMSHELRTPLNAVIGFSEILTQQMFGPLGDRYQEYSASILESGRHLLAVINDILDLSKVEAGHYELDEGLVDMVDIADQVCGLLREQGGAGRLVLQVAAAEDLPLLWADERLMRQILLNLVGNAIKFTPAGGRIVIGIEIAGGDGLRVEVRDNGIGMSETDIERALIPFGQAASVLARRAQGTGLGLPLARQFVALHGGDLVVTSQPGQGTTVSMLLPSFRLRQPNIDIARA
jgi:signal transduction histidine kinase